MLTGNEIRKLYLDYFKNKHQHTVVESSSLVPDNPTVLLTTAGMLQFLPIFLGIVKSPYDPARATSCQKCARAGGKDSDIENVGRTPRHHTFFEMLGNFSFGDYYKKEIIPWAWEFVTEVLKLDKDRLWITIFETDDEAYEIWRNVGVPAERIKRKGKKDNFWGPPGASGSCGPCSEIHYDLGEQYKCNDPRGCGIDTCECDRWVEIWNLVFTELYQDEEGNQSPLESKNVDTGMGLERITMVCQGVASTFETDLLRPILDKVSEMSGVPYKKSEKTDVSLRIITDHARCVSFLISDGVIPGNEGRSYVLRMILRRALRHGKILGMELPFLYRLVDVVVDDCLFFRCQHRKVLLLARGIHTIVVGLAEHKDAGCRIFDSNSVDIGNVADPFRILFCGARPYFKSTDLFTVIGYCDRVEADANSTILIVLVFDDDAIHS